MHRRAFFIGLGSFNRNFLVAKPADQNGLLFLGDWAGMCVGRFLNRMLQIVPHCDGREPVIFA
jgi:hypothetical protein